MTKRIFINKDELKPFGSVSTISEKAKSLVLQQQATWQLAKKNYEGLKKVQVRSFDFDTFRVLAQFNPERIRSTAAKPDEKTISKRPCFLCPKNLPSKQKGFLILKKYLVLINPYPIFPAHLTISDISHTPQLIRNRIDDLLEASKALSGFTVFYNGPRCGASAPGHFHFQAGITGHIPAEKEVAGNSEEIFRAEKTAIRFSKNYLRRFIAIDSEEKSELKKLFSLMYKTLEGRHQHPEPMVNILCRFRNKKWQMIIFPRDKQRPSHYFSEGEKQIVIGPASVEMGGLLILPRIKDFNKISEKEIKEIYSEVTISEQDFNTFIESIRQEIKWL